MAIMIEHAVGVVSLERFAEISHMDHDEMGSLLLDTIAENNKLRTFLGGNSIVTDYWKDWDGTMHVLTTDGEHTYEYMRGGLAEENAKLRRENTTLRELALALTDCRNTTCDDCVRCDYPEGGCSLDGVMRELGINATPKEKG